MLHLQTDRTRVATLWLAGVKSVSWKVEVGRDVSGVSLTAGWRSFVDNNIKGTHILLLMRYKGNMQFNIIRYGKRGDLMYELPANASNKKGMSPGCAGLTNSFVTFVHPRKRTNYLVRIALTVGVT